MALFYEPKVGHRVAFFHARGPTLAEIVHVDNSETITLRSSDGQTHLNIKRAHGVSQPNTWKPID